MTDLTPVLQVQDLTVSYGDVMPVQGITFAVRPGERIGLVGESGSGKSLTALSIMRLNDGATLGGSIRLRDRELLTLSPREMTRVRGGEIAMVYQDPMSSLNPVRTIGHQLVEAIRLHDRVSAAAARARAVELLTEVGVPLPEERLGQYPHEFSGGMRQRVMIAMAMSSRPAVLIADEPTTALDVTTQSRIIDLLDRLAEDHGTAVVLITHDLGVAAGFCERIHVMRHGRVVEEGPVDRIYTAPEHPYTQALLGAVVDLTVDVQQPIRTAAEVLERGTEPLAEAGSISAVDRARESGDVLVDVQGVSKVFTLGSGRRVTAVDDVSFQIRRGETVGLVGESGSGKSTVSKAVLALGGIDGGTVVFDGQRPHDLRGEELRRLRKRMQMVFQDPFSALNRRQTVAQIIEAPLRAHGIGTRASRAEKVRETMHRVRLDEEFAHRLPRSMSGGQCQRVSIARSLVLEPEFLVLDESVSALDVSIQAQVLNLLRELHTELGLTYLFISHDLAVIRYMSSTVAVMQQGRIVEIGARDALFANPQHEYTRGLMAAIPIADPVLERRRRAEAAALWQAQGGQTGAVPAALAGRGGRR
ncbi:MULTISPECIES: ABC transporter ATP-binding protein [unclassified Microbacterium]|uniref:dipeptide ABC transporter ATP-binding protein n=1 Tax=unclassified Microbacterium TaxID=2609290 RepID=UPI0024688C0E|nr:MULTISPECIES: ABC transporter ATP-binding protein [unclassified Microbacterium]MDH5134488.1 ABC transporter ATP-binding protein [Microbacterium sp. RD10]MDH5138551.1 ABC transporter ATP-binding protein [Microbacterium sp. RD11]MDH5144659.1 ABC transporter ATP-binding protein [Microbacterium sp. RD12]MDH5155431.1 ABC transporter ATP-binding protein [Microbacterium sp. RD06]MDH5167991.1 ABC transporter ATP-binding protein [Microbacterium sp. RD02]